MPELHLSDLGRFVPMVPNPTHDHTITTGIVGYVVRETIANGDLVELPDGRVGRDVAVISGASNYSNAFPIRDRYRDQPGGYAVIDFLYGCGCRGRA